MTTCVVAARVGKEGSRQPSLLGRNRRIKITAKQQTSETQRTKKFEERGFLSLNLATISLKLVIKLKPARTKHKGLLFTN